MPKYRFDEIAINSTEKKKPVEADKDTYIGLEHLDSGCLEVTRWGAEVAPVGDKLVMHKGDVLFGRRRAYQKKVSIAPFDGIFSAHGMVLRPIESVITKEFFPFFISSDYFLDAAIKISVGSLSPTINWRDLAKLEFQIPSLDEQASLSSVLWAMNRLKMAYTDLLQQADALVQSQFVEMFGDPRENPNGYKKVELSNVSEIMSGITKGRKPKTPVLRTVPYLCTANVQNGFLDWTETKHIDATEDEIVQYSLLADDVLMIEGGDPDKVGRGCLAGTTPEDCIFQNHVFRVRTNKAELIPQFLALYILLPSTKEYFLNCAKQTTGIATINKKQLSSLMVVCPPVAAQAEYIRFAEQADKSKLAIRQALESLEKSRSAIITKVFG